MKRIATWFAVSLTVVVLLFGYHTSTNSKMESAARTVVSAPAPSASSDSSSSSSGTSSSSGSSSTQSKETTGDVAQTQWGPVQVKITTAGSKITAVDVVQYPSDNPRDQEINAYAVPTLVQETLDAQSANVQMISGGTVTSRGYITSLQSALDKAGV